MTDLQSTSFEKLPGELRNLIYHHIVHDDPWTYGGLFYSNNQILQEFIGFCRAGVDFEIDKPVGYEAGQLDKVKKYMNWICSNSTLSLLRKAQGGKELAEILNFDISITFNQCMPSAGSMSTLRMMSDCHLNGLAESITSVMCQSHESVSISMELSGPDRVVNYLLRKIRQFCRKYGRMEVSEGIPRMTLFTSRGEILSYGKCTPYGSPIQVTRMINRFNGAYSRLNGRLRKIERNVSAVVRH
ncbi:hypothetical protein EV356DRAFT_149802 [Viridothelium virens]|uniref:Uncharacterized protein n=1 Tax=Viridothelium virens TaxID=1048519 RepID=A0A6A6HA10_VIRVR|nr:hypothetical protein EV356DRAFT_149802 [Viridothelium virens]